MSLATGLLVITTYERMGQTKDDGKRYREERTGKRGQAREEIRPPFHY